MGRTLLSWSGGKDAAVALQTLRDAGTPPDGLVTTVASGTGMVSHQGVERGLLERQAAAVGLPLLVVELPDPCPNDVYVAALGEALAGVDDLEAVHFGDLHLADLRAWRTAQLATLGVAARFPLWGTDTGQLARRLLADRWSITVVTVDTTQLDASFCGRTYDAAFLADLPDGVDPAGEGGEFHTFVTSGPVLRHRAPIEVLGTWTDGDGRFERAQLRATPRHPAELAGRGVS